jgi:hypothetical protein
MSTVNGISTAINNSPFLKVKVKSQIDIESMEIEKRSLQ